LFHYWGWERATSFAERKTVAQESRSDSVSELYVKIIETMFLGMRKLLTQ